MEFGDKISAKNAKKLGVEKKSHEQLGHPQGIGCYWDERELLNDYGEAISWPGTKKGQIYYIGARSFKLSTV